MIYCNREELKRYHGLHPNLDRALDALETLRPDQLPEGKTEVDGERVYINCFHYETGAREGLLFETHFRYADIHLPLSGTEGIAVADAAGQAEMERNEAEDYLGTRGASQCDCRLAPGKALVVFPGEAHRSGQALEQPNTIYKLVVKVLMT